MVLIRAAGLLSVLLCSAGTASPKSRHGGREADAPLWVTGALVRLSIAGHGKPYRELEPDFASGGNRSVLAGDVHLAAADVHAMMDAQQSPEADPAAETRERLRKAITPENVAILARLTHEFYPELKHAGWDDDQTFVRNLEARVKRILAIIKRMPKMGVPRFKRREGPADFQDRDDHRLRGSD
jgi:hypothetical protein